MARRSSARLQARSSTTPQPERNTVLFQDGQLRTPKTAPQLTAVAEADEMPGAFPASNSPNADTPSKLATHIAAVLRKCASTPNSKPIRPSSEEMHPEKFHASTSKPLDEARWLGFSAMEPRTEPPKGIKKWAPAADTPTKAARQSSTFEFTFRAEPQNTRAQSLELSSEAKQMMAEKREEAARIKREMVRIDEESRQVAMTQNRKIAKPRSKAGRFSDVHLAEFKKMDSISAHVSASRPSSRDQMVVPRQDIAKVSRNKKHERTNSQTDGSNSSEAETSPAKRVRLDPFAHKGHASVPTVKIATPSVQRSAKKRDANVVASRLTTPTRASAARAATVKINKTSMIPSLVRTPSKSASKATTSTAIVNDPYWLSRSPTKIAHMSAKKEAPRQEVGSPLLAKSPTRNGFGELKHSQPTGTLPGNAQDGDKAALLARSPMRMAKEDTSDYAEPLSKTPLLARSPTRAPVQATPPAALKSTPGPQTNLMDRFKLLRQSPIKSILRSPQRLYSNDPEKIANGTHLATPPVNKVKAGRTMFEGPAMNMAVPATEPIVKHVEFTASTKSNDESPLLGKVSVIEPECKASLYPTLSMYPTLPQQSTSGNNAKHRRQTLGPLAFTGGVVSGQAKDFTFRATPHTSIVFGSSTPAAQSPKPSIRHVSADPETASSTFSRKRKFVEDETIDEDDVFQPSASRTGAPEKGSSSDKENDVNTANIMPKKLAATTANKHSAAASNEDHRPAKKARRDPSTASAAPASTTAAKVPSWAQGTAAQKARAALATATKKRVGGGSAVVHKARLGGQVGRTAPAPSQQEHKQAQKQDDGTAAAAGGGPAKVVLSRARLDALSQPKRRVGS